MSNQRGFTLIEVLLASFIFMSVVTIAIGSFTSQINLQSSSEAQRNVQQTAQSIVETISRDVRTIEEFRIQGGGSCVDLNGPGVTCGDRLEFSPLSPPGPRRREYRRTGINGSQLELVICDDTGCGGGNPLNDTTKVLVRDFRLEGIEPDVSPPAPRDNTTQPFVLIYLDVETVPTGRREEQARQIIRTVVSSRLFEKYR